MRPVIGVGMNFAGQEVAGRRVERAYLDSHYIDYVFELGATPLPIAPIEDNEYLEAALEKVDGVLMTGGNDIDPSAWQEERHPETKLLHKRRERFDFRLYDTATRKGLPIMGICLGVQIINVAHGGSLYQHLPEKPGTVDHGREGVMTEHELRLDGRGRLHTLAGEEVITVKSCHHQGIHRVGEGLLASGVAEDGVTEVLEREEGPFLMAVQWHPEREPEERVNWLIGEQFMAVVRHRAQIRDRR